MPAPLTTACLRRHGAAALWLLLPLALVACGGGSSPLDNPPTITNSAAGGSQKLCFEYFQRCVNPIFFTPLSINLNGVTTINTCAGAGCHDDTNGTGGAFRLITQPQPAQIVDTSLPANTPDVVRGTPMYRNFYSAQGEVVMSSPQQSRLLTKPQLVGVLHGGGLIFGGSQDPNVRKIHYWIEHPALKGEDEFGASCKAMFTPADPTTGTCNSN